MQVIREYSEKSCNGAVVEKDSETLNKMCMCAVAPKLIQHSYVTVVCDERNNMKRHKL